MLKFLRRKFDRNFLSLRLHEQLGLLFAFYLFFYLVFLFILTNFGGSAPEVKNWRWWVYAHMVDAGTIIESAKINTPVVNICGFLMNILNIFLFGGIFISLFTNFFEESAKRVHNGQARDKINKEHHVILGWDVVGASIVHKLIAKKKDKKPIVILSSRNPEDIRADIMSYDKSEIKNQKKHDLSDKLKKQIYILNGSFTNRDELNSDALMLRKAETIYILGENNSTRNDSDTISTALHFANLINDKQKMKNNSTIPLIADIRSFSMFSQLKSKVTGNLNNNQENNKNNKNNKNDASKPSGNNSPQSGEDLGHDKDSGHYAAVFNFCEKRARRIWSHISEEKDKMFSQLKSKVTGILNNNQEDNKDASQQGGKGSGHDKGQGRYDAVIFNFYENWARRIWSHIPEEKDEKSYYPLAYVPVTQNNFVHLIIIGFGQMGQALAVEAARVAHYGTGKNTRITVIDNNMTERKAKFVATFALKHDKDNEIYSWYEENGYKADVEFVFKDNSAEDEEIREFLVETAKEAEAGNQIPTLAICFSKLDTAFETALSLPIEFTTAEVKSFTDKRIPVLLRNESDYRRSSSSKDSPVKDNDKESAEKKDAAANREKEHKRDIDNIDLFGNLKECTGFDEQIETFAKVLNMLYKMFNDDNGVFNNNEESKAPDDEDDKEDIEKPDYWWKKADEYSRWASRHQAAAFVERLRSMGYKFEANTDICLKTSERLNRADVDDWQQRGKELFGDDFDNRLGIAEHYRWSVEKWLCGYRYDKEKVTELHKHPCLIDYSKLNEKNKNNDLRSTALAKWILENYCGVTLDRNE